LGFGSWNFKPDGAVAQSAVVFQHDGRSVRKTRSR
jgi:hypothetical protein